MPQVRKRENHPPAETCQCNNEGCGLLVFRRFLNKELTDQHLAQLFFFGNHQAHQGLQGKKGRRFDAALAFDKEYNVTLSFPKPQARNPETVGTEEHGQEVHGTLTDHTTVRYSVEPLTLFL
ncbi:topoisomerase C-terminal repeat-containing protein [Parabacteroides gordonii]|uniref:topoisomerase C-terminal repeat-containing protein n=1 Tax=Parabacteroides gordonii TaxID=574930 RepID=UPI00293D3A58|nr:topoisomerase C-terminal repeat-containing protein [Parabacteroides gordonii]